MDNNFQNLTRDLPEIIVTSINMEEPNESINIYFGDFKLTRDNKSINLNGSIYLEWLPNKKVRFKGTVIENNCDLNDLFNAKETFDLFINDLILGACHLSGTSLGGETHLEGVMIKNIVYGDKSVPVSKIHFNIPNLRDFFGDPVKCTKEAGKLNVSRSRLVFENDEYSIRIDRLINFKNQYDLLSTKGGYIFLYSGEIIRMNGSVHYDEMKELVSCFSFFLSFLNGRRCSLYVLQGIFKEEILWTDYTPYATDLYKTVFSWPQHHSIEGLNLLWKRFSDLWKDDNDRDFLISAIHWYVEANSNSGYTEGSIIMTQTGLELIYNWLVIEKKKLIYGKDVDNISASNKIRLLLSQISLKNDLPDSLKLLRVYITTNGFVDGVEAFVQIRNALVHSQEEKRKKLQITDGMVLYEALELGLWYLELSILNILNFEGNYQFRCSDKTWAGTNEISVPWI